MDWLTQYQYSETKSLSEFDFGDGYYIPSTKNPDQIFRNGHSFSCVNSFKEKVHDGDIVRRRVYNQKHHNSPNDYDVIVLIIHLENKTVEVFKAH